MQLQKLKRQFKKSLPGLEAYRWIRRVLANRTLDMRGKFTSIYRENAWGDSESVSGGGSTLEQTQAIRKVLPDFLNELGVKSLVDAPCGDFGWLKEVDLGELQYLGLDVVDELIDRNQKEFAHSSRRFDVRDITREGFPRGDLILCRDCWIHFSYRHTDAALRRFKESGSTYLLTTTYTRVAENHDIQTGSYRPINLELAPYHFPKPIRMIPDGGADGRCLALWKLDQLGR